MESIKTKFLKLPSDYRQYVATHSGRPLENEFNYLVLYKEDELVQYNIEAGTEEFFPNFIFIAETDNSTFLGFRMDDLKLYSLPPISDPEDAMFISNNFTEFLERFEKEEIEIY